MLNLQPGQKLAGFEIKGTLGTGGMGTVYLAFDHGLRQARAIKVVKLPKKAALGSGRAENLKARFMQEARVLAALDHKNIIRVFQVGEESGHPYLVMEYFVGQDLIFWLKSFEGLPPVEPVIHVVRQLAEALQYAHELDNPVVHRDIKLANALLDANGTAKLIDFGLAKSRDSEKLTETRASVGTIPYWAPEYVAASLYGDKPGEHTALTDLWALGVMAYILLTNQYPIYDGNQALLLKMIADGKYTPIRKHRPHVSEELADVLQTLLHKDPDERFSSARAFIAALDGVSEMVDVQHPDPPPEALAHLAKESSVVELRSSMVMSVEADPSFSVDVMSQPPSGTVQMRAAKGPSSPSAPLPRVAGLEMPASSGEGNNPFVSQAFDDVESISPDAMTQSSLETAKNPRMSDPFSAAFVSQVSVVMAPEGSVLAQLSMVSPGASPLVSADSAPPNGALPPPPSSIDHQSDSSDPFAAINSAVAELSSVSREVVESEPSASEVGPHSEAPELSAFGAALEGAIHFEGAPSVAPAPSGANDVAAPSAGGAPPLDIPTPSEASLIAPAFVPKDARPVEKKAAWRTLALPVAAFLSIVTVGFAAVNVMGGGKEDTKPAYVDPDVIAKERTGKEELRRLERVPKSMVPHPAAVTPAAMEGGTAEGSADEQRRPRAKKRSKKRRAQKQPGEAPSTVEGEPQPNDAWAARFGTRDLNSKSHKQTQPAEQASAAQVDAAKAGSGKGTKLPARLRHELSSSPAGPVVAKLTKAVTVGAHDFPAGTELHGSTSGTAGTRILVTFSQARFPTGKTVAFSGRALARDGRPGLKGRRTLGGVSDVGASALEAGARSALNAAGDAVGDNPAGAAVKAGGGTAAAKSKSLNAAESIVVVKKSTRFVVYVDSIR